MKHRRNQSGVALVITLIMLSVITIIAVAFLALSQRERASTSQSITGTEAELMSSTALERGKSHVLAEVTAFLSTNTQVVGGRAFYRRPPGTDLAVSQAFTNQYTLYNNWTNMGPNDYQALTNLVYDPQVPVFTTNHSGAYELVDYLDLNRNGRFDPTGIIDEIDANGTKTGETNFVIGDPQWIGVLARPNEPHSSSNRFVGRYAYIILPAGRTLDINFIHNNGKQDAPLFQYMRSQGHGSWEINLAAFLADLNNNNAAQYGWGGNFSYTNRLDTGAAGRAFQHAADLLNFRYAGAQLWPATNLFGAVAFEFNVDDVDQFANGWARGSDNDEADTPWPGSSNPQQFFSVHDFFNPHSPSIQQFQDRLRAAGSGPGTYNAHTFYRMLAQIGTDSAPERMRVRRAERDGGGFKAGDFLDNARINLNYENTNDTVAADFIPWNPTNFFHVAADRLLREYGFQFDGQALSVTNLPVYPTNYYSAAVHRVLQITMNIFDATTNFPAANSPSPTPYYPTVLKPLFETRTRNGSNEVYIAGYRQVQQEMATVIDANNWRDLTDPVDRAALRRDDFVYGVPLLIGAKKGYPNFNEYAFQSEVQVHRKLELHKPLGERYPSHTNQAFHIGVSNFLGMEVWNSYRDPYPRQLIMFTGVELTRALRNDENFSKVEELRTNSLVTILPNDWKGQEFRYPTTSPTVNGCWVNDIFQPLAIYNRSRGMVTNLATTTWESIFPAPQWELSMTNRFRMMLFDNGYIVDAVALAPIAFSTNLTRALAQDNRFGPLWRTNRNGGIAAPTAGITNQILASLPGIVQGVDPEWNNWEMSGQTIATVAPAKTKFGQWLNTTNHATTVAQVPFTPHVKIFRKFEWRANDPLVHYMDEDLRRGSNVMQFASFRQNRFALTNFNIGQRNEEYYPWGGGPGVSVGGREDRLLNPTIIDPRIRSSDDWDFPTNKFATLGWLGRVHRGTPWQTIYWKAAPAQGRDKWLEPGVHYSLRAHPTNDWILADVFTVAQHPNASRGRLSVNQTNVAAWSALLSGAEVSTFVNGNAGQVVTNAIIQPVLREPHVENIVRAINARREALPGKVYNSLREFIGLPELTMASPWLNPPYVSGPPDANTLTDRDYEAIPEKILSLIHVGEPRFVVYAFGQSLKPAPQSILTGGNYRGLVTNYEVSGELATRTVMRVELEPATPPGPPIPRVIVESFNISSPD
jgi:hypothetical protein